MEQERVKQNTTGLDDIEQDMSDGQDLTDRVETTWEEKRLDRMGLNFNREGKRDGK